MNLKIRPFTTKSEEGNTIRGIIVSPKEFTGKLPAIVMSHEFCANMWTTFRYARKENPIKKVNDFSMTIFSSEIFTDDLKEDLKPFKKSSRISVFKI